jgi:hypothetical protein
MLQRMFSVNDEAVGPHLQGRGALLEDGRDHERLVLEARDVAFAFSPAARASH